MHPRQSSLILALCAALAAPGAALAQDVPAAAPVDDPTARRIVEEADRIRFPAEGFQVEVSIVSTGKDKVPDERKYIVAAPNEGWARKAASSGYSCRTSRSLCDCRWRNASPARLRTAT